MANVSVKATNKSNKGNKSNGKKKGGKAKAPRMSAEEKARFDANAARVATFRALPVEERRARNKRELAKALKAVNDKGARAFVKANKSADDDARDVFGFRLKTARPCLINAIVLASGKAGVTVNDIAERSGLPTASISPHCRGMAGNECPKHGGQFELFFGDNGETRFRAAKEFLRGAK